MNQQITIALTKGRVLGDELEVLENIGIRPLDDMESSRKLVFETNMSDINLMILRGMDVATYVEHGIADLGMSGRDVILEHGGNGFYEPLDLHIGKCDIMVAGLKNEGALPGRLRIATKFVNTAKRFYAEKGVQVDIIKLYGAMELAPVTGLAHRIVDIVETGNTLRANGLEALELIEKISTYLIVNKISLKTKYQRIQSLIDSLGEVTGS
jgi:ATP phosphoribosyltransferase